MIGGLLGDYGLRAPFYGAAALSLLNFLYGYFILPESLAPENRSKTLSWRSAHIVGALQMLRSQRKLALIAVAVFLSYLAHDSLPSLFVLYSDYRYHWDTKTTGLALAVVGVAQTLVSGGLVRPFVARFGERVSLTVALASGALGFAVYALAPNGALFMSGIAFIALWGMANPSFQALATRLASASEQGGCRARSRACAPSPE